VQDGGFHRGSLWLLTGGTEESFNLRG
jgi:hypothetical protein